MSNMRARNILSMFDTTPPTRSDDDSTNTKHVERAESGTQNRVEQQSALIKKLPYELRRRVFSFLGPATQRLFGATCSSCYIIYKDNFYKPIIAIDVKEVKNPRPEYHHQLLGTPDYIHILTKWLFPPNPSFTPGFREDTINRWLRLHHTTSCFEYVGRGDSNDKGEYSAIALGKAHLF